RSKAPRPRHCCRPRGSRQGRAGPQGQDRQHRESARRFRPEAGSGRRALEETAGKAGGGLAQGAVADPSARGQQSLASGHVTELAVARKSFSECAYDDRGCRILTPLWFIFIPHISRHNVFKLSHGEIARETGRSRVGLLTSVLKTPCRKRTQSA